MVKVWAAIRNLASECSESSECRGRPPRVTRRDIHQAVRRRSEFARAEDIDPIIEALTDRYYLRPAEDSGQRGKGHRSPTYLVNPNALAAAEGPCTHSTHSTH